MKAILPIKAEKCVFKVGTFGKFFFMGARCRTIFYFMGGGSIKKFYFMGAGGEKSASPLPHIFKNGTALTCNKFVHDTRVSLFDRFVCRQLNGISS